jgi:hypothetical protein
MMKDNYLSVAFRRDVKKHLSVPFRKAIFRGIIATDRRCFVQVVHSVSDRCFTYIHTYITQHTPFISGFFSGCMVTLGQIEVDCELTNGALSSRY